MAHSKGDDDREPAEVQAYWERDPLVAFARENPEQAEAFDAEARRRIDVAVAQAEAAPYAEAPPAVAATGSGPLKWRPTRIDVAERLVNLIHDALGRNMERDDRIVLIGEDIEGPYGGAFKVTKNLSRRFPGRVCNTPISEAAIVGLGNGLALCGLIPVCEIMFGDFLTLAADQLINHAAKFRHMYNDQVISVWSSVRRWVASEVMDRHTARAWRSTSSACPTRVCSPCTTATIRAHSMTRC